MLNSIYVHVLPAEVQFMREEAEEESSGFRRERRFCL